MHVESSQGGDNDKVWEDEGPAAGPRPPESAADVRNKDANLDGQRSGKRLTHGDGLSHLVLGEPSALLDQLALHLPAKRYGTAEANRPEPQIVEDKVADTYAGSGSGRVHPPPSGSRPSKQMSCRPDYAHRG